ncbi:MAG: glycosyltransferase [Micropruina sp.]|nr:glycosyltransferase [Micropruina sp.]
MRILFVSEATGGGSPRSQRELATMLVRRGHALRFVVADRRPARLTRRAYELLSDLSVRLEGRPGHAPVARLRDRITNRIVRTTIEGLPHWTSALPQNILPAAIDDFRPDVIVVNSVERWAWRRIHATCAARGIPTVLYVREDDSLKHLDAGARPQVLLANAASLAHQLRAKGHDCAFIPSVVDTSVTLTDSSRRTALAINPIPSRGGDIIWKVAERLPDIPFVVQESWPLPDDVLRDVNAHVARLPNLELRRVTAPGPGLYGDARVLLVPYRVDNRPRVILEAQSSGIPVIVGNTPALVEAIGDGGVCVELDSIDDWVAALRRLWDDAEHYQRLADAARLHSRRQDVDPVTLTDQFESLLRIAVDRPES